MNTANSLIQAEARQVVNDRLTAAGSGPRPLRTGPVRPRRRTRHDLAERLRRIADRLES